MFIKKIRIKNYKCINNLEIELDKSFNVLIGQNNIGKTTIIEAVLLWKKCYDLNITSKGKKFYANAKNLSFSELDNIRISDDRDLFNSGERGKKLELIISLLLEDNEGKDYDLGFLVVKAGHIDNAYLQISYLNQAEFTNFSKLSNKESVTLRNLLSFTNTRPIPSIIKNEPYMFKPQIRQKINKGKSYEVLRNKIVNNPNEIYKIEAYMSRILEKNVKFIEKDKENKEYIKLYVSIDGCESDILSQGSGFLQIVDIFSSFEFFNSELNVLLIDEPDSHIHLSQQIKLLNEFRMIPQSQSILVSHNERFIDAANDNEILFVNENDRNLGLIKPLQVGAKKLVLENLVGEYSEIERLKNSNKILIVEGPRDKERLIKLIGLYINQFGGHDGNLSILFLNGIDGLPLKIGLLANSIEMLVKKDIKWIIIRDTDCIPLSNVEDHKKSILKNLKKKQSVVFFHKGYEFESTLFTDLNYLAEILQSYYKSSVFTFSLIENICTNALNQMNILGSPYLNNLEARLERQKGSRKYDNLSSIKIKDIVMPITSESLSYLLCKANIDLILNEIHCYNSSNSATKLDANSLFEYYINDFSLNAHFMHPAHEELIKDILNF